MKLVRFEKYDYGAMVFGVEALIYEGNISIEFGLGRWSLVIQLKERKEDAIKQGEE